MPGLDGLVRIALKRPFSDGTVAVDMAPLSLLCLLDDPKIPPDNNASESALRAVALGRKNFLFVGHEEAGENIAGLYSLVATCEANDVNPYEYLRDVMMRVSTHPADRIDELPPDQWKPAQHA